MSQIRLLRSVLFCPGDREKLLQKALSLNFDALIVDLEDAVGQSQKITARDQVHRFLQSKQSSKSCVVRINCPHRTGLINN
jgi:citrate lyase subunit beta / citryl-CoA lyase